MKANPLLKLSALGQSIWLDYIRRQMISQGINGIHHTNLEVTRNTLKGLGLALEA